MRQPAGRAQAGDELLVWTTTPWTLVSNAAVAVNPELLYARARADNDPAHPVQIVAAGLVGRVRPPAADGKPYVKA